MQIPHYLLATARLLFGILPQRQRLIVNVRYDHWKIKHLAKGRYLFFYYKIGGPGTPGHFSHR